MDVMARPSQPPIFQVFSDRASTRLTFCIFHKPDTDSSARLHLNGNWNYLISCPLLDQIGFVSHKALRILICRKCQAAFIPADVLGHAWGCQNFRDKSPALVEEVQNYCDGSLIHSSTDTVIHPAPRGPPVEGIHRDFGLACSVDPANCAYCCRSKDTMETHVRSHSNRPTSVKDGYRTGVTVQTLFPKFARKFFEVEPALSCISGTSPLALILRDYLPSIPGNYNPFISRSDYGSPVTCLTLCREFLAFCLININRLIIFVFTPTDLDINPPASEKERTPFMRFMKWDRHMADIRMCKTQRSLIKSLKAPATPDDPGYSGIFQVILDYLLRGMAIGWGHNNHARVRKHLAQGANVLAVK